LPLAARIGEAEIDVFHVVILDHLHDVFSCGHRTQIPLVLNVPCETGARGLLDGIDPGFTGPDPDGLFDIGDEYLAVANSTSLSGAPDRIDRFFHHVVADHDLDFHLREKIDDVFGAPVELRVSFLPTEALGLGDGDPLQA